MTDTSARTNTSSASLQTPSAVRLLNLRTDSSISISWLRGWKMSHMLIVFSLSLFPHHLSFISLIFTNMLFHLILSQQCINNRSFHICDLLHVYHSFLCSSPPILIFLQVTHSIAYLAHTLISLIFTYFFPPFLHQYPVMIHPLMLYSNSISQIFCLVLVFSHILPFVFCLSFCMAHSLRPVPPSLSHTSPFCFTCMYFLLFPSLRPSVTVQGLQRNSAFGKKMRGKGNSMAN